MVNNKKKHSCQEGRGCWLVGGVIPRLSKLSKPVCFTALADQILHFFLLASYMYYTVDGMEGNKMFY